MVDSGRKWRLRLAVFYGRYNYSIDDKGRLIVPAGFRETIASEPVQKLYLTFDIFDSCLHLYPYESWKSMTEEVMDWDPLDDHVKYYTRRVVSQAHEVEIDKQGRIQIPVAHRAEAGIKGEVVITGALNKIEIWDKSKWDEVNSPSAIDKEAAKATFRELYRRRKDRAV